MDGIDIEDLRSNFYYDETSPTCLRHAKNKWTGRNHSKLEFRKGEVAGGCSKAGNYLTIGYKGKMRYVHRVVMLLLGHNIAGLQIDHVDNNFLNNKVSNLRIVTNAINNRNRVKLKNNSSGVTGVNFVSVRGRDYFRASCTLLDGPQKSKWFSISVLGIMVAFRNAVIHRQQMVLNLNTQGAGYSERHGI